MDRCHHQGYSFQSLSFSDFCRITKTNFLLEVFSLFSTLCHDTKTHRAIPIPIEYVDIHAERDASRTHTHSHFCIHKMMKICYCALSLLSQCHLFRERISVVNSPNRHTFPLKINCSSLHETHLANRKHRNIIRTVDSVYTLPNARCLEDNGITTDITRVGIIVLHYWIINHCKTKRPEKRRIKQTHLNWN